MTDMSSSQHLRVTYLELCEAPRAARNRAGTEHISLEAMTSRAYLSLYRRVGEPLRWDQRLLIPDAELETLLGSGDLHIYVVRNALGDPLGFCEFDRSAFPQIELKHFGLLREAQGQGIGPWLLSAALHQEWKSGANRIWLHTDTWDHPAAVPVYERAGFRVYDVRYEPPESL
jgi:GNAT superfamily N-acetyltransferase